MAKARKVFLDANWYIDVALRDKAKLQWLDGKEVYYSPLSTQLLFYVFGLKVPQKEVVKLNRALQMVPLTAIVLQKA